MRAFLAAGICKKKNLSLNLYNTHSEIIIDVFFFKEKSTFMHSVLFESIYRQRYKVFSINSAAALMHDRLPFMRPKNTKCCCNWYALKGLRLPFTATCWISSVVLFLSVRCQESSQNITLTTTVDHLYNLRTSLQSPKSFRSKPRIIIYCFISVYQCI